MFDVINLSKKQLATITSDMGKNPTHCCTQRIRRRDEVTMRQEMAISEVINNDAALYLWLGDDSVTSGELNGALSRYDLVEKVITRIFGSSSRINRGDRVTSHAHVKSATDDVYREYGQSTRWLICVFLIELLDAFEVLNPGFDTYVIANIDVPDDLSVKQLRREIANRLLVDAIKAAITHGSKDMSSLVRNSAKVVHVLSFAPNIFDTFRRIANAGQDALYRIGEMDDVLALVGRRLRNDESSELVYGRLRDLSYLDGLVSNSTICRLSLELLHHEPKLVATEMRAGAERLARLLSGMPNYEVVTNTGDVGCSVYRTKTDCAASSITLYKQVVENANVKAVIAQRVAGLDVFEVRSDDQRMAAVLPAVPSDWLQKAMRDLIIVSEAGNVRQRATTDVRVLNVSDALTTDIAMMLVAFEVSGAGVVTYHTIDQDNRVKGMLANGMGVLATTSALYAVASALPSQDDAHLIVRGSRLPTFKRRAYVTNISDAFSVGVSDSVLSVQYAYGDHEGGFSYPLVNGFAFDTSSIRIHVGAGVRTILDGWNLVVEEFMRRNGTNYNLAIFSDHLATQLLRWYEQDATLQQLVYGATLRASNELSLVGEEHYIFESRFIAGIVVSIIKEVLRTYYHAADGNVDDITELLNFIATDANLHAKFGFAIADIIEKRLR